MTSRIAWLLLALWASSLVWTYRFAEANTRNETEAAKVPAVLQVIAQHDDKAVAGQKVEQAAERRAAATTNNFEKLEREVLDYAQEHPLATDCSIEPDGLRIWRDANSNTDAEAPGAGQPDPGLRGSAAAQEREDPRPAGQPRRGGEEVPPLPGTSPGPGQVDGDDQMTDVFDRATETEEETRTRALNAQAERSGLRGKTVGDSATECAVCECPIPQERREAVPGVLTCFDCQAELERATRANTRGYA